MGKKDRTKAAATTDEIDDLFASIEEQEQQEELSADKTAVIEAVDGPEEAPEEPIGEIEQLPELADSGDEVPAEEVGATGHTATDRAARILSWVFLALGLATAALALIPGRFADFSRIASLLPTPLLLLTAGVVLGQLATLHRNLQQAHSLLEDLGGIMLRTHSASRSTRKKVREILGNMQIQMDRPPASGEELSRVLTFMQKQDEKLVNLNHASKMYGKAIVDLSSRVTDLGKNSDRAQELMDQQAERLLPNIEKLIGASGERVVARVEERVKAAATKTESLTKADVEKSLARVEERVSAAVAKSESHTRAEVEKVAARVEERVKTAVASSESLTKADVERLLDHSTAALLQKTTSQVEQQLAVLKELLRESRHDMTARLGSLASEAAQAAQASKAPELDRLVRQCESIQKAMASLEEKIATLATAPREQPSPAAEPARQEAPPAAAPPAAKAQAPKNAEPASEPTGSSAKSAVHGAIAKLKKLRGN